VANRGSEIVNQNCHFPFTLNGIRHDSCTTDGEKVPWCATEVLQNGLMVIDKWGYCNEACHREDQPWRIPLGQTIPQYPYTLLSFLRLFVCVNCL